MHDSLFRKRNFLGRLTATFVVLTLLLALVPPVPVSAADGALDPTFNPGTGANNTIIAAALQPDGTPPGRQARSGRFARGSLSLV